MSSSTSGSALARARSLRKPSVKTESTTGSGEGPRNVSPSRLPVKGQASTTASSATRPTRSATVTSASTKPSRPLSGVFARITSTSSKRETSKSDGPETSPTTRLTRASSIRQPSTSTRPATSGTASTTRPTTSSGVPTSRPRVASGAGVNGTRAVGHVRTKSSVTTLSSTTTLRPPSQTSSASSTATTTTAGAGVGAGPDRDRSRPPLTSLTRRPSTKVPSSLTQTPPSHRRRGSLPLSPIAATPSPSRPPRPQPSTLSTTTSSTSPSNRQPPSTSTTTSSTKAPPRPSTASSSTTTTQTQGQQTQGPPPRPAFTTHQQSFTPALKRTHPHLAPPPKPLTSTFLAPPSPSKLPANVTISAETARLQTELLQLHLMHRDVKSVVKMWEGSAEGKLKVKWEMVKKEGEVVNQMEEGVRAVEGERAVRGWLLGSSRSGSGGGLGMEEKVAVLDEMVSGIWGLVGGENGGGTKGGGRYERVVGAFERWVGRAEAILEGRKQEDSLEGQGQEEVQLIGELDPAWREECSHLVRKLDDWRRKLRQLGDVPDDAADSSVGKILAGCRALVHGMLAELNIMEEIEREAAAEEMRWVREINRRGADGGERDTPRAGAIWRVL